MVRRLAYSSARRQFLKAGVGFPLVVAAGGSSHARAPARPPNILLLLADDLRADTLRILGNRLIYTPVLDRLATRSAVFVNTFVTYSICAPSRASIMSGRYVSSHGIYGFQEGFGNDAFALTYHSRLRERGYRVGYVGKWGVGGGLPHQRFDFFEGFEHRGQYFEPDRGEKHLTEFQADRAIAFLAETPATQPFCLTVGFWAPHADSFAADDSTVTIEKEVPFDPRLAGFYESQSVTPLPNFRDAYGEDVPRFLADPRYRAMFERRHGSAEAFQRFARSYYRLVTGLDQQIGRILAELEVRGLLDTTLVIFTSDNGYFLGEHGLTQKFHMYEESIRIPLMVHFPNDGSGFTGLRQELALNIDVSPTILAAAGLALTEDIDGRPLQHVDQDWREDFYYEYLSPLCLGIRSIDLKYMWFPREQTALMFDLRRDPYELQTIADHPAYRTQAALFRARLEERYRPRGLL